MHALVLSLFLAAEPAGPCFEATDASPGWKQVTLPDDARELAAPEGIEQLRAGVSVTVVDDKSGLYLAGRSDGLGVTTFDFPFGDGGRALELRFVDPLRGAKVDVTAYGDDGPMALMREERIGGAAVTLSWGDNDVRSVTVRVHEHLRKAPVLYAYKSTRRVPLEKLRVSSAFHLSRSLYYRQPAGPAVLLCEAAGRTLVLKPESLASMELPVPVVLKRR